MPPFIEVIREVTDDPGYMAHCLAKIDYYIYPQDQNLIKDVDSEAGTIDEFFKDVFQTSQTERKPTLEF